MKFRCPEPTFWLYRVQLGWTDFCFHSPKSVPKYVQDIQGRSQNRYLEILQPHRDVGKHPGGIPLGISGTLFQCNVPLRPAADVLPWLFVFLYFVFWYLCYSKQPHVSAPLKPGWGAKKKRHWSISEFHAGLHAFLNFSSETMLPCESYNSFFCLIFLFFYFYFCPLMLSDNSVPQSRLQHLWMLLLLPRDTQVSSSLGSVRTLMKRVSLSPKYCSLCKLLFPVPC